MIEEDSPLAAEPLSRVGIPPYDIVRIDGAAESGFFLLAADRGESDTGWGIRPLSGDEITFGEMSVREPERRQRPDRDRKFACLAYEVPGRPTCRSFSIAAPPMRSSATPSPTRRSSSAESFWARNASTSRPANRSCGSPTRWKPSTTPIPRPASPTPTIRGRKSLASATRSSPISISWVGITPIPASGSFLSHHDLFIHQQFFAQPLQVAYVVDPINQTRGFFQWRDGGWPRSAVITWLPIARDRVALARLVNELEQVPNSEANSGGTFSPRLEAELINMLSRPVIHRDTSNPVERAQVAAVFGLFGAVLGMFLARPGFLALPAPWPDSGAN